MTDIEMPDESPNAEARNHSQKLEDEIRKLAQEIKHHEDNLQRLQTQTNNIEETILDLQVRLGKYHVSVEEEHIDNPLAQTEKCIIRQHTSAAGIICRIKKGHAQQASTLLATKDVLGVVATLGKVSDDNLSRLFSEFLGLEKMLGLVCKTYRDIEAFEKYDKEGIIDKSFGLHGLGASMGRSLKRYPVYCLELLRPYVGEFVAEDSQKQLDLLKPRLPNGECPPGFLGFAVNMINVDHMYLSCLTAGGHGLRETLFYSLFSRWQVYKTRAQMIHAIPCVSVGAVFLDGGMMKSDGLFFLGDRNDVDVRFPVSTGVLTLPAHVADLEEELKFMNWRKERLAEDVKREKTVLHHKNDLFCIKSQGCTEFLSQTTALKSGAFHHEIHYWLGKDTSQDEAGAAAIKTVELDASLGGRAVQYRELQGHETDKFLSYFKPCIIPQQGGVASGFKHTEVNEQEHQTRLYVCKGKHVVHVKEISFSRASLNHDDIFILDTKSKIFQFNGSNSSIQERAKALEVVQYIKDTYHDGKCEVAAVEDGKLMSDADAGEFWGFFGGFAPLPRKTAFDDNRNVEALPPKLLRVDKEQPVPVEADSLTRELLDTSKCYLLDCGIEMFVWIGRSTSLEERKSASVAAEEILRGPDRPKAHVIRVIEGFETVVFRSKFDSWPQATEVTVSEDGRGKVAALLKRQGLNVKGLTKAIPVKEEPQPYIDCTGNLQVWRVNGVDKVLLPSSDQSKFYSGDCYIFQYTYTGDDKEEYLVGTWFGQKSTEEERRASISLANKMVEALKYQAVQSRFYEGKEPVQFFSIFQSFIVFKGGISSGYKNFVSENSIPDETYTEDGIALFRIQGSGPDNMQAIQVEPVASSLNSSYCYILHGNNTVFTWSGSLSTSDNQELLERQLDVIKPSAQSKSQKEGTETEQFWALLGGKGEYPSHKIGREPENDPHLFSCTFSKGSLKVTEIYNFTQDDLMTEDLFILDCHSDIFVWIGQQVDSKTKLQALTIGEKFLEHDYLMEKLSRETPVFIVMEGNEPPFFTRFFTWDSAKSAAHGNSFQRKLEIVKNGATPTIDKPKRRTPISHAGRSSVPDKSQRSRSMSFSPDRVRVRGRSPAFNALAATFENPNANRNLSTPPPVGRKLYPKSVTPDSAKLAPRSTALASLGASFEHTKENNIAKVGSEANKPKAQVKAKENNVTAGSVETPTIQEDVKEDEAEDEEGLPIFPYERLKTSSADPVTEIDVTRRETYLSSTEFKEKFGMAKNAFYKLPKWKQNKLKMAIQLF